MLYKHNNSELDNKLFVNPTCEYRGTPFWSWNGELKKDLLVKEIDYMKEMGMGGFHMHSRVGLATPYLSDEFMDCVKTCVDKAKNENMLAWLYDEDRWSSGSAGGKVTENIEYREKLLFITRIPYNDGTLILEEDIAKSTNKLPESKYIFLACYDVICDDNGDLISYKKIDIKVKAKGEKWYAYCEYAVPSSWYNNNTYVDTLNEEAIKKFIEITHERYKEVVGSEFDKTIPAIFSDEPLHRMKKNLEFAKTSYGVVFPYTLDFPKTYKEKYNEDIFDKLPELYLEFADGHVSNFRYKFNDHIAERFAHAFADTIGAWCERNNIMLCGHAMNEPTLSSQNLYVTDCMRLYRGFQLPGVDMLADKREFTTVKQAASASHQYGREGVLSELYGVTNYTFDFRGHKLQGDWQAALGVTVRVHHLFWMSMSGEAKRDYPAPIGYQSPWYKEYKYIEDHFARVNTLMTRGKPIVKIGVIHPIESYWLHYGPNDKTSLICEELDTRFLNITDWLLKSCIDFDFINESLLVDLYKESDNGFVVGEMKYETIIVPYLETIRTTTLNALQKFKNKGGRVIFMGDAPKYLDALENNEPKIFAQKCENITWSKGSLLSALKKEKDIEIKTYNGKDTDQLLYQMRKDGEYINVFICHHEKPSNYDNSGANYYYISFPGKYSITEYDTLTGEIREVEGKYESCKTTFLWRCGDDSSILLRLKEGNIKEKQQENKIKYNLERTKHIVEYSLSEPNVVLLDECKYSFNGGEVQNKDYILHVDDYARKQLGLKYRGGKMVQPWLKPYPKDPKDILDLYYEINSEIEVSSVELALESIEYAEIWFNDEKLDKQVTGYYVDEDAIKKIRLPNIKCGKNTLHVQYKYGEITQIEAMYLLGDFGVKVRGDEITITNLKKDIAYGDICNQGLPFYGGNITYKTEFEGKGHKILVINKYKGAVIKVKLDGKDVGYIAYPPYELDLGYLSDGVHSLEITLFGNRMNTFGTVHITNETLSYCSPAAWRLSGINYNDEYILYKTGILNSPFIFTEIEETKNN